MKGTQRKATVELTEKRTMLSELKFIHEAKLVELTTTKKRLNVAEISLSQTHKIRDRLRLELQVVFKRSSCPLGIRTKSLSKALMNIDSSS
jgi:hypothetical protein